MTKGMLNSRTSKNCWKMLLKNLGMRVWIKIFWVLGYFWEVERVLWHVWTHKEERVENLDSKHALFLFHLALAILDRCQNIHEKVAFLSLINTDSFKKSAASILIKKMSRKISKVWYGVYHLRTVTMLR